MSSRPKFDLKKDFVVGRLFTFNGRAFVSGKPFDKSGVSERRLRQLYEQRYLQMVDAAPSEKPSIQGAESKSSRRRLSRAA